MGVLRRGSLAVVTSSWAGGRKGLPLVGGVRVPVGKSCGGEQGGIARLGTSVGVPAGKEQLSWCCIAGVVPVVLAPCGRRCIVRAMTAAAFDIRNLPLRALHI